MANIAEEVQSAYSIRGVEVTAIGNTQFDITLPNTVNIIELAAFLEERGAFTMTPTSDGGYTITTDKPIEQQSKRSSVVPILLVVQCLFGIVGMIAYHRDTILTWLKTTEKHMSMDINDL